MFNAHVELEIFSGVKVNPVGPPVIFTLNGWLNSPYNANTDQKDFDGDGQGDVCDPNPVPKDTFSLKASDETCKSSDNGSIQLTIITYI